MYNNSRYPFYLLFIILITVIASCSKRLSPTDSNKTVFYPPSPDTARIQFLTRYGNSIDFTGKRNKFKTFVLGEQKAVSFIKPYGIALYNRTLFIADAGIAGLEVYDFEKNTFEFFIPTGRGKLSLPINCFIDTNGDLYISDVVRRQVVIFDKKREYIGEIGGEENFKPTDVVVTGDTILVTDPSNNRVNIYDKTSRKLLSTFPQEAEAGDRNWLYNPMNLCVAGGEVYVTDFGDSRIKTYNMKGEYLNSVGSYGKGLGQFVRPKGIAVDHEENLFVVDAGFQNVQVFNKEGQLLMFFGGHYNGPGDLYLPAKVLIDYEHLSLYEKYVNPAYKLNYLIFIVNQYGPDKISVYGRIEPK